MDIRNIMDVEKLQSLQDKLSEATGLTAVTVDAEGENVTKCSGAADFCLKKAPENTEEEFSCSFNTGMAEFYCNITVNGEVVAKIVGGGVLNSEADEDLIRIIAERIAGEADLDADSYVRALRKLPVRSEEAITASAQLFADSMSNLVNLEYIRTLTDKKIAAFDAEMTKAQAAVREANSKMRDLERNASVEKILAINASIEAARAGEAGVGFAVVAREIGTLANEADGVYSQVTKLVKEISDAIEAARKVDL